MQLDCVHCCVIQGYVIMETQKPFSFQLAIFKGNKYTQLLTKIIIQIRAISIVWKEIINKHINKQAISKNWGLCGIIMQG